MTLSGVVVLYKATDKVGGSLLLYLFTRISFEMLDNRQNFLMLNCRKDRAENAFWFSNVTRIGDERFLRPSLSQRHHRPRFLL